jgi:hypothetical protein
MTRQQRRFHAFIWPILTVLVMALLVLALLARPAGLP